MSKRLDNKTFREAAADAETTPWWVHELIAEAKRARESEARFLRVLTEALCLLPLTEASAKVRRDAEALIAYTETGVLPEGVTPPSE